MPAYIGGNPPAPSFKLGAVMETNLESQDFIGYKLNAKIDHENMTKLFMQYLPKAGMHAQASNLIEGDYTPGAVFTKWDEEKGEAEFYIGLLLRKEAPIAEGMKKVTLTPGKNVMITKYGPYGTGDTEARRVIDSYLK